MLRKNLGNEWESRISSFLESKGMKILERNYTVSGGEIDIIAQDRDFICFIEVKYRSSGSYDPYASVGRAKQKRILKAAQRYLTDTGTQLQPRFDVVFVFECDGEYETEYYMNAFGG